MSNIIPQSAVNNQGLWAQFEDYCRTLASGGNEVLIVCGPSEFSGGRIGNQMSMPGSVWKLVVVASAGTNSVASRVATNSTVIAIKTPNDNSVSGVGWTPYVTSIAQLEADTGFTFLTSLPRGVATYLKQIVHGQPVPALPYINSFSPASAGPGATVTLSGVNFGSSAPAVKFNGVSAVASVSGGGTQISATVPAGAVSGAITVETSVGLAASTADFSVTSSPTGISLSTNSLSGFSTFYGTSSTNQSYAVSGSSLSGPITITAPLGYEISLTNNTAYTNSLSLTPVAGTIPSTGVFVRINASVSVGSISGTLVHSGGGATAQNLALSGSVSRASPAISWNNPTAVIYGTALSGVQLNATSSVAGNFTYSPTNGAVLNAGTNSLTTVFTANDTTNYVSPLTNTVTLVVGKATPGITWSNPATVIYGTALSGVQLNATSGVAGSFTYSPTNGSTLNAGTNLLTSIFRPTDTNNYVSPVTNTVNWVVTRATPALAATPTASPISYGQALSNSVLSGGTVNVPGSFAFTTPATVPASSGAQSVTFTPSDATNYNSVNTNITVTVNPASATVTLGNLSQTYNGSARAVNVTTTPSGLGTTVTYNGATSAPTNAGNYTVIATITDPSYSASATNTLSVAKAAPGITWTNPAAITYGTALSATQLNATSSVSGTYAYTPTNGVVLNAGTNTLTAVFRATDSNNYVSPLTNTVSLSVNKATPSITAAPTASSITVGQALSNSILSGGSASVAGVFAWTASSTIPSTSGSYPVTFSPTDAVNYTTTTTNVSVVVNALPASLILSKSSLNGFTSVSGTASASQSYGISGLNLTSNVVVTAPTGYEVSLDNSDFSGSKTLVSTSGSLSEVTVFVRLSASAATGSVNGTVTNLGGGATSQNLAVSGIVAPKNSGGLVNLATWTFETSLPSNAGPYAPENGTQVATAQARCVHASSSTGFAANQGNGSAKSYWANTWAAGDYFEFRFSTIGLSGIQLSFDQTSSGGGPRDFRISCSTNGGVSFSDLRTYAVPTSAGALIVWYPTPINSASSLSFDLSSFPDLNNQSNLILRLVCASGTSMSGGSLSNTGSSRIDNVVVSASSVDTVAPVINLNGLNPETLLYGQNFVDPATCSDNSGYVSAFAVTGRILNTVLGSYVLTYTATDGSGNASTTTRTVNVVLNSSNSISADSDRNGMPDLVEYALGGSPTGNSSSILPSPTMVGTNLRISFLARTNDSNLIIRPVVSTNLVDSNSWGTNGIVKTAGVATNNGFELQTWETPAGNSTRKFLKVNISR